MKFLIIPTIYSSTSLIRMLDHVSFISYPPTGIGYGIAKGN